MGNFFNVTKEEVEEQVEEQEEYDETDTYEVSMECRNCGDESSVDIPKGTTVKDHMKNGKCDNCGCVGTLVREGDDEDDE